MTLQPSRQQFPTFPSSLNAGDHEMRDFNAPEQTRHNTVAQYTPYLGLPSRLSQIWLNRWTILLILIVVRLIISTQDLNHDLDNARAEALSACTSVENVGSAMASMPHFLSDGVNTLAADGMTNAVHGLMSMLALSVTVVEEIVSFYINMLTSTYVCLITLVVGGSLHAAVSLIEEVGNFVNETIGGLAGDISTKATAFDSTTISFLNSLNIPAGVIGPQGPPQIMPDITSQLDSLRNITIDPAKFDKELTNLNASIPTFENVHNFTNNVLRLPFEDIRKLINDSRASYTFDKTVFPRAQKQSLTFCSDSPALQNFFDGLKKVVMNAKTTSLAILIVIAILVCIPMGYQTIRGYKTTQSRAKSIDSNAFDPIDVVYIASRPYTAGAGLWIGDKLSGQKSRILARWFIAYITTLPVLFVLALAAASLITCIFQYIILKAVEKEVPVLLHEVGDFADVVVKALDQASNSWAAGANTVINSTNSKINEDVIGWVNTSTTTLNDTLNAFSSEMIKALNVTFGGTILSQPVQDLYDCLIGLKIAGLEKTTTWIHDNAQVDFPVFRNDVFSLGAAESIASNSSSSDSFLASPGNTTTDGISNAIVKVTTKLERAVKQEVVISACLFGIWLIVFLMGAARVAYAMLVRDKTRAEGGNVGYINNNPPPPPTFDPRNENIEVRAAPVVPYPIVPTTQRTVFPMSGSIHSEEFYPPVPEYDGVRRSGEEDKVAGSVASREVDVTRTPAPRYQRASEYGEYGYMGDGYPVDTKL